MNGHERIEEVLPTPKQLFTPGVVAILIAMFAGLVLSSFAGPFVQEWLALNPQKVIHGMVWQLATYWIVHTCPWTFVLNGLIVLTVGSAVERHWRTRSFLALWMVTCLVTGLVWVLVCLAGAGRYLGAGSAAGCFGLFGALGLLFRGQRFYFFLTTVEARVLAWILIGIGAVFCLFPPINLIWVLGALVAFVYIKLVWRGAQRARTPRARQTDYRPGSFVDVD
ncbi:MAG: rhomboid family intramembrane serine protease [Phycisphaerae bacterium]|nr:rhomboid family intramembrane serine protease [Phycisphaerae bacterium]